VRVLLDENLPHRLRNELTGCEAFTATYAGFSGLKNGALLRAAIDAGFDVLVTADQTLQYEQNLVSLPVGVVLLSTNLWELIRFHTMKINLAIEAVTAGTLLQVECGRFNRRRPRGPTPSSQR